MKDDYLEFLRLPRLPALLTARQLAWLSGLQEEHIPILVREKFFSPAGHPKPNAVKLFATVQILPLLEDPKFLGRVRDALSEAWAEKNQAARARAESKTDTHSEETVEDQS